jgi:hypothetical protein
MDNLLELIIKDVINIWHIKIEENKFIENEDFKLIMYNHSQLISDTKYKMNIIFTPMHLKLYYCVLKIKKNILHIITSCCKKIAVITIIIFW